MKLVRIGWESWDVLAVCDARGRCQVIDFLLEFRESSPAVARGMLALLRSELPASGPVAKGKIEIIEEEAWNLN